MVEWARARARQDQEERRADYRYQVERKEEHEFGDLAEGEWGVDRRAGGFAEHLDGVWGIMKENAGGGHEVDEAFANECCLERRSVSHLRARGEGGLRERGGSRKHHGSRHTSKTLTSVSSTMKASNSKATSTCPSPRTRKTALNHAVGPWKIRRNATCGR